MDFLLEVVCGFRCIDILMALHKAHPFSNNFLTLNRQYSYILVVFLSVCVS